MKHLLLALAVVTMSSQAFAVHKLVKCYRPEKPAHYVIVYIGESGKIIQANDRQYVLSDNHRSSIFSYLSEDIEKSGFEGVRSYKGRNGYAIITLTSTADSVSVGVSPDYTTGFYSYQDLGSGAGNRKYVLSCGVVIR